MSLGALQGQPTVGRKSRSVSWRVVFLVLGGMSLLIGMNAGLLNLGSWAPSASQDESVHGFVMTAGFLGTLISLERAQALAHNEPKNSWAFLAPGLLGAGGILLGIGGTASFWGMVGHLLMIQGALVFSLVYLWLWRRAPLTLLATQILSAVPLLVATILVLRFDVSALIPLLGAFLIITIASERAELAQLSMGPRAVPTLLVLSILLVLIATGSLLWPEAGARAFGAVQLVLALWLIKDDAPRHLIKSKGIHRYTAIALLTGYFWLIVGGITWIATAGAVGTPYYDVVIHAIFIGFAFTMIMAHAPTIFPAVMGIPVPYRPIMYVPLVLLNLGLALRIFAEITVGQGALWVHGGQINVIAILLFVITIVGTVIASEPKKAVEPKRTGKPAKSRSGVTATRESDTARTAKATESDSTKGSTNAPSTERVT